MLVVSVVALATGLQAQQKQPLNHFTNSIGMKFVWIPPGTFLMGSPKEEQGRSKNETPHKVTLTKGFYLSVYAVTQEQWQIAMGDNPSYHKGEKNLPVESISWEQCQKFLIKLGKKEGHAYRLPTEAEWEYACRAGSKRAYCHGDDRNLLGEYAWYSKNSGFTSHPVGQKKPNVWGLHDMHGNVWQWCDDWYGEIPQNAVIDPKGPNDGDSRVVRGCSSDNQAINLRSALRYWYPPTYYSGNIGFRVARSLIAE